MTSIINESSPDKLNLTYLDVDDDIVNAHGGPDFVLILLESFDHLETLEYVYDIVDATPVNIELPDTVVNIDILNIIFTFGAKKF